MKLKILGEQSQILASKDYLSRLVFSLPLLRYTMKMTLISIKIHLKGDDGIFSS